MSTLGNALGGTFSHPRENLEKIVIGEGSTIVDLGTGSGHYAQAAAKLTGVNGRVYAVDIQHGLVRRLQDLVRTENLHQLEVIHGDVETVGGSKIASGTSDLTLLCNILFQVDDRAGLIKEAMRVTKDNGRICVVDWTDSNFGMGPDEERIVDKDAALLLFEHYATLVSEFDAGDHHYGLLLRKQ